MKRIFYSCLILGAICSSNLYAQAGIRPVSIEVRYNSHQEPVFYAINKSIIPYTVIIDFSNLQNTLPRTGPAIATAQPGRTKITTLEKYGFQEGRIRFNYIYRYNIGCHNTEPNENVEYLIPVAPGRESTVRNLFHINELTDEEAPEDYYSLAFSANSGDTIYAARGGIVGSVVEDFSDDEVSKYYTTRTNRLQIIHEDCTFGNYNIIKKGSVLVRPGQKVFAGDPIALVPPHEEPNKEHFRFSVSYKNPDLDQLTEQYWKYVIPHFRTNKASKAELEHGSVYRSVHADEVITQEMSRRERRRWRGKQ